MGGTGAEGCDGRHTCVRTAEPAPLRRDRLSEPNPKETVMRTVALSLVLLAAAATPALAEKIGNFEIQTLMSEANNAANVAKIKRAFSLAAKERGRQAIEISCAPASSDWCANDFVAACDKNKGGMSTNPEGGVTCSLPQYE